MTDPIWTCKVCGAEPDNYGWVRHGKGCYQISEDGGGEEYIEIADTTASTEPSDHSPDTQPDPEG